MLQVVVHLKGLKEFHKDLTFCFSSLYYIWMFTSIINILNVVNINKAAAVDVDLSERLFDERSSEVIQFASNGHQEFVDVKGSVSVGIKLLKQGGHILLTDTNFEIFARLCKFRLRDTLAVVIIHYGEELLQTNNASRSSCLYFISEQLDQVNWVNSVCFYRSVLFISRRIAFL